MFLSFSKKQKRIYLDNAGATPMSSSAKKALLSSLNIYGNPSAIYQEGDTVKHALDTTRAMIGSVLNARAHEIYFTGTGTESCNLAIMGTYLAWKKENPHSEKLPHIIISSLEHPAVMEVVNYLSLESLANVTYLPVYKDGIVKLEDVKKAITEETILVSVMYANNEIGTVQPIKEIGRYINEIKQTQDTKRRGENVYPLFHTDACQAGNYLDLDVYRLKVDMMTLNGSKIYGPKGIALLYKKEGIHVEPVTHGGGQERNLRSGTENYPLAQAFAIALKEARDMRESETERLTALRTRCVETLTQKVPNVTFYGSFKERLPNNINCRIPGIPSDEMIIRLDTRGFAVSHKSACASSTDDTSYVIKALGGAEIEAKENIRITLGRETREKDILRLVDAIAQIYTSFAQK